MELTHVRLLVDDFPACFRFYRDKLGLSLQIGEENGVYAEFQTTPGILSIFRRDLMDAAIGQRGTPERGSDRVVITLDVGNVDEAFERLGKRGVEFIVGPTDRPEWFLRTAHLRDPDDNLIELYENMPMEEHDHEHQH